MTGFGIGSGGKLLLALVGALFVLAMGVQFLENAPPPGAEGRSSPGKEQRPLVPKLRRLDVRTIMIDTGFFQQSRIRFSGRSEQEVDAIYDCLDRGIDQEFRGTEKVFVRRQMLRSMQEIQDRCVIDAIEVPDVEAETPRTPRPEESPPVS